MMERKGAMEHSQRLSLNLAVFLFAIGFTVPFIGTNAYAQTGSGQSAAAAKNASAKPKPYKGLSADEINAPVKGVPGQTPPKPALKPVVVRKLTPEQIEARKGLNKPTQPKEIEITGEVVDAWCYASQTMGPGQGEGHKACALAGARRRHTGHPRRQGRALPGHQIQRLPGVQGIAPALRR